jgi:MbtH protein
MKTISLNSMLIAIILVAISGLLKAQDDAATIFKVVVNHEGDYFIWPAERELPVAAWKDAGKKGTKQECLDYIKENWTDQRPLSLRKKMEEIAGENSPEAVKPPQPSEEAAPETPAALDVEAVSALLEELQAGLSEFIDAEDDIATINEKWQAREDLTDQTKKRILELLFEDVESVIADEEIRKAIWDKWNSDEVQPD